MKEIKKTVACFLIILQCLIFGLAFIAIKILLDLGFPTFFLLFVRFTIGACSLLVLGVFFRFTKASNVIGTVGHFRKEDFIGGIISGIILFSAFSFQTFGAGITTPAKNGLLTDLFVIFVPLISMVQGKKLSLKPLICALIAFLGVAIVTDIFSNDMSFNMGDFFSGLCGLLFAIQFIVMEIYATKSINSSSINPYNFTIIELSTMAVLSLIISLFFESNHFSSVVWENGIGWLLYLGICGSAIAYLFQFLAQSVISAGTTSVLSCSETVFTIIFSLLFGYDRVTWQLVLGSSIIILAMLLTSIDLRKE